MTPIVSPSPDMEGVTELEDGSAIIEAPEGEEAEQGDFYSNIAETLGTFELNQLASNFEELLESDREARKKRDEQYEEGLRRTGMGDDAPGGAQFSGASRAVHPILAEGCVDFAARAIKELFPANGPVKTKLFGKADTKKLDKAKKKRDYLNFLLTKRMPSYRDEKEVLLTQLPLGGSQYEKYFVDPETRAYKMEFVPVDKMLLPSSAVSFLDSPRMAQMLDLSRHEFERRVKSGFYKDILITDESSGPEPTASESANNKIEGKEADQYNEDGLRRVYEISAQVEIDGEEGWFVIHFDEPTNQIVAIYRNWAEDDELAQRLDWWVESKFIPWRGAQGIGLPQLIGGLAASITGGIRALLDSAHINNSPGAVKLKGGRTSGENLQIEQTQVQEIEAPAGIDDIRKVMMPLPFNPPSAVLFQLVGYLVDAAKGVITTAEEKIADASNSMPVGTTLALIEQGSQVFSAIHARLHESQRRGLNIICRLIKTYPNIEDLQKFELTPEDFDDNDDIQPVSDPNIFSESQRYAQLQEALKIPQMFPEQQWNRTAMARRAMELLRVDFVDEWLPPAPQEVSADPVSENFAAVVQSAPLKAQPDQDHVAHLRGHLSFILSPLFGAGPIPGQPLGGILQHCNEHLMLMYQSAAQSVAAIKTAQTGEQGELAMAEGSEFAMQQLTQQLDQLGPMLQQAAQLVQSKMPQPPVDPAVQKTFEAAMAEIKRKADADVANQKMAASKLQGDQQMEAMQSKIDMQLAQMAEQSKQSIVMMQEQSAKEVEQMRQQVELMKNEANNRQHQITELMKNTQDNQTAIIIEKLKQAMQDSLSQEQPEVEQANASQVNQAAQLEQMLKAVQDAQDRASHNEALGAMAQGIHGLLAGQQDHQQRTMQLAQQLMQGE